MAAAAVEEHAGREKGHVENELIFYFEHVAYVVSGAENIEDVSAFGRGEVDVEAGGGGFLLYGGEDGARVL